jgi:hypothetical protein
MTNEEKKAKINKLVNDMLENAIVAMRDASNKAINSGAVDVGEWDENRNPMLLPKAILIAVMENEASQYDARGTYFEKQIKKDVKNIKAFI